MAKSLDQRPKPWFAHEQPERPLDRAVFVCGCAACMLAVRAAAEMGELLRFVVRGERCRRVLTTAQLAAALAAGRGLADLLPGDRVRDVGPAAG